MIPATMNRTTPPGVPAPTINATTMAAGATTKARRTRSNVPMLRVIAASFPSFVTFATKPPTPPPRKHRGRPRVHDRWFRVRPARKRKSGGARFRFHASSEHRYRRSGRYRKGRAQVSAGARSTPASLLHPWTGDSDAFVAAFYVGSRTYGRLSDNDDRAVGLEPATSRVSDEGTLGRSAHLQSVASEGLRDETASLGRSAAARRRLTKVPANAHLFGWARLVSNQRPLACEASALPLSYAPSAAT